MQCYGGCQCGAVRFVCDIDPERASICHCRMCQKAFGNVFAPLVSVREGTLRWTKAEPKRFQSSNVVKRGFCPDCGTPLTYEAPDGIAIAIGALDDPSIAPPVIQYGTEAEIPFVASLHTLPHRSTMEDLPAAPFLRDIVSYQHPDRPEKGESQG
ncbi:MAG: GFA family protein [Fulvimarina manganoxydans]|nr:GFA family protein [Fulvimarina manganoxydans]MCK5931087.1 GFA family protein [Fulvimarina manganoxydans]MEE2952661.1 GFA family protein [Pseudomonadota bacterium]